MGAVPLALLLPSKSNFKLLGLKKFLIIILCAIVSLCFAQNIFAKTCQECHPPSKVAPNARKWHAPFIEGKCEACHGGAANTFQTDVIKGIKWFQSGSLLGGKAYIVLSPKVEQFDLVFRTQNPWKQEILSTLEVPSFSEITPPEIVKVWFLGLEKGPWIEAKVLVQTTTPCKVSVSCDGATGSTEENYYSYQVISIPHVEEGNTYNCVVEAEDFNGVQTPPQNFTFTAQGAFENNLSKLNPPAQNVTVKLFRSNLDELVLEIASDGKISWKLGGIARSNIAKKSSSKPADHPHMNPLSWSSIDACYSCHKRSMFTVSHPVNVALRPFMANDELPLFRGVITCATCHNPHGSAYPYDLRKYGPGLCKTCHKDK